MRRALLVFSVGCVFVFGCGKAPVDMTKQMEKAHKTQFSSSNPNLEKQKTPEWRAAALDEPAEKAEFLRQLATDKEFDPKQHVEMLKKYSDDRNEEVAAAAKELLAKAQ